MPRTDARSPTQADSSVHFLRDLSVLLFVLLDWVGRFLFPFSLKPSNSPGNSRRVAPTLALRPLGYLELCSDNRSRSIGLDDQGATQLPQSFSNAAESHTTAAARIHQFALLLQGDALPVVPNFNRKMAAVLLGYIRLNADGEMTACFNGRCANRFATSR
jgi:hypothetical protein